MSSYAKIKIILTLLISVVLSYLVYVFLSTYNAETVVIVAKVPIDERQVIKAEMLEERGVRLRERDLIAPRAAKSIKDLENTITKIKIPQGKVLVLGTDVIKLDGSSSQKDENGNLITDSQSYFINPNQRLM